MSKIKKKISKNNIVNFPSKLNSGEREVEALVFAAAEPLDVDTIESKVSKKVNVLKILEKLIEQCQKCGIKILELPFVDSSSLKNLEQQNEVIKNFESIISIAEDCNITLSLETDLESKTFLEFLEKFNSNSIRANYDVGNSISKNFDSVIELDDLKNWIVNVHIKDRLKHGHTVPLGSGDVKFQEFFEKLKCIDYRGDLILQGAREDLERKIPVRTTCSKYLEFINRYLEKRN